MAILTTKSQWILSLMLIIFIINNHESLILSLKNIRAFLFLIMKKPITLVATDQRILRSESNLNE